MSERFRMDKTVFRATNAEDANNHVTERENKTPFERLEAAWFLTMHAYGIDENTRMDKTVFNCRKREN